MVGDLEGVWRRRCILQLLCIEFEDDEAAVSMAVVSHCGVKSIAVDALMIHRLIRGGEARAER